MSTSPAQHIPEFDLADRMRKTLRDSDIAVHDMADYLDVSRNTVSAWINGRITPDRRTLIAWALKTGVPIGWLLTGQAPTSPFGGDGAEVTDAYGPRLIAA